MKFKNALKVFKRDLKGIFKNPISIIIIVGLCIVPSLYSFLNIISCYNAYSNTGKIQIAIVNEDKGASLAGKSLNVGDGVVDNLKKNNVIDWQFVSSEEGKIGLASGKYFAEMIIPSNFSENLTTLTSNNPTKPNLIYKVNTKLGPVANKIAEVTSENLLAQIRSSIIEAISSQMTSVLNTYGEKANENKNQIIALKDAIINLNNNFSNITNALNSVSNNSSNLNGYLNSIKGTIPIINNNLSEMSKNTGNLSNVVSNTKGILNTSLNNIGNSLNSASDTLSTINTSIGNIKNSTDTSSAESTLGTISSKLGNLKNSVNGVITFLNKINSNINSGKINALIGKLNNTKSNLESEISTTNSAIEAIKNGGNLSNSFIDKLMNSNNNTINSINSSIGVYNNQAKGEINGIFNGLINSINSANGLINNTENLNNKIQNVISSATDGSALASSTSSNLSGYLNDYRGIISSLGDKLNGISNDDINKIISLLEGNPLTMGTFVSSPFNFLREAVYPVSNYGSGMTPVYSVLAFWVGGLLLTSLLKVESVEFEGSESIGVKERHFGKMLTFVTLGIIQAIIIALGSKYLLDVQVISMPLLLFGSILTAVTFNIIIFTIVSIFRTMGKAIAIILMVVQLSGTGGTYPVQAMPAFFRFIEPYVPFPYGVGILREAIGGPYIPNVIKDIKGLIIFCVVFLLIGYFFREPSNGFFNKFEAGFKKSGVAEEE